jgi:hypothetical protein
MWCQRQGSHLMVSVPAQLQPSQSPDTETHKTKLIRNNFNTTQSQNKLIRNNSDTTQSQNIPKLLSGNNHNLLGWIHAMSLWPSWKLLSHLCLYIFWPNLCMHVYPFCACYMPCGLIPILWTSPYSINVHTMPLRYK